MTFEPSGKFEFEALRWAENYRRALLGEFRPYLTGKVIEVGAGIGQFTSLISAVGSVEQILALEPNPEFCAEFPARIPKAELLNGVAGQLKADVQPNAIVSINVLEHIEQDLEELRTYARLLAKERGHLCLFVPARPEIYAPIDGDFGHFRRYSKAGLQNRLAEAGFEVVSLHYYNCVGYFAWWLNFCVLKKRSFEVGLVRLFDRVVFPLVHQLESRVAHPPFGQSLFAVARSPG